METLADGRLRVYPRGPIYDTLDAYRAAYNLRATEGPLVILAHLPERDAETRA